MTHEITTPLVSIITPVLNRAETIESCLGSVSSQTYAPIEQIVVDGGSTDGTLTKLEAFGPSHDLRWISEPDRGMYEAINKGIGIARGEILAYLNSDDLYFPWTVETAVESLTKGADLVYGDLALIARRHRGPDYVYLQFYPPFDFNYYTHVGTLAQPTVFWKRGLTGAIGLFDDSYLLLGDCEYWLRAASSGARLDHIPEVMAIQVEHEATLRALRSDLLAQEFGRLRRQYLAMAGPSGRPSVERLKKSIQWRRAQLRMRNEIRRPAPARWRHFIEFLHEHEIDVDRWRLFLFMLPAQFRPDMAGWLNPQAFEEKVMTVIGGHGARTQRRMGTSRTSRRRTPRDG